MQEIDGVTVKSRGYLQGHRWHSVLSYSNEHGELGRDHMEWQIFTPREFCTLATTCGFTPLLVCTWANESLPASADMGRMQIVLEKASTS